MMGRISIPPYYIDVVGVLALGSVLFVTTAFLIAPIAITVLLSFDARSFLGPFPPLELGTHWYVELFRDRYVLDGLRTSLIVGIVASGVATLFGAAAAVALHFKEGHLR